MRIVLASNNKNKVQEINELIKNTAFEIIAQSEFNVTEVEENAPTFVENALIKARHACEQTGLPAIADDSGVEVDALDGAPGIFSARFAGPNASYADNVAKLLQVMRDIPEEKRSARFQCILVFLRSPHDPTPVICQGTWEGKILHAPRGNDGFCYDPIFFVPTHNCSAAELKPIIKNTISHRALALTKLLHYLTTKV
jgi:XTP/dITP diphosphohydrolase